MNTQWAQSGGNSDNQPCVAFYSDSGTAITVQEYTPAGITGTPTLRHWETIERLQ
jgi:hypothetical protein